MGQSATKPERQLSNSQTTSPVSTTPSFGSPRRPSASSIETAVDAVASEADSRRVAPGPQRIAPGPQRVAPGPQRVSSSPRPHEKAPDTIVYCDPYGKFLQEKRRLAEVERERERAAAISSNDAATMQASRDSSANTFSPVDQRDTVSQVPDTVEKAAEDQSLQAASTSIASLQITPKACTIPRFIGKRLEDIPLEKSASYTEGKSRVLKKPSTSSGTSPSREAVLTALALSDERRESWEDLANGEGDGGDDVIPQSSHGSRESATESTESVKADLVTNSAEKEVDGRKEEEGNAASGKPFQESEEGPLASISIPPQVQQVPNGIMIKDSKKGEVLGPYTEEQVQCMYRSRCLRPDTLFKLDNQEYCSLDELITRNGPACPFVISEEPCQGEDEHTMRTLAKIIEQECKEIAAVQQSYESILTRLNDATAEHARLKASIKELDLKPCVKPKTRSKETQVFPWFLPERRTKDSEQPKSSFASKASASSSIPQTPAPSVSKPSPSPSNQASNTSSTAPPRAAKPNVHLPLLRPVPFSCINGRPLATEASLDGLRYFVRSCEQQKLETNLGHFIPITCEYCGVQMDSHVAFLLHCTSTQHINVIRREGAILQESVYYWIILLQRRLSSGDSLQPLNPSSTPSLYDID